jgi:hypothetical protein
MAEPITVIFHTAAGDIHTAMSEEEIAALPTTSAVMKPSGGRAHLAAAALYWAQHTLLRESEYIVLIDKAGQPWTMHKSAVHGAHLPEQVDPTGSLRSIGFDFERGQ